MDGEYKRQLKKNTSAVLYEYLASFLTDFPIPYHIQSPPFPAPVANRRGLAPHPVVGHEAEDHGGLSSALDGADGCERLFLERVPQQRLEEVEAVRVEAVLVPLDELVSEPDARTTSGNT